MSNFRQIDRGTGFLLPPTLEELRRSVTCSALALAEEEAQPIPVLQETSPRIIRLEVMLYIRCPLSLRNVEDMLHKRGIEISHESVPFWWNRFGPILAAELHRRRILRRRQFHHWQRHLEEMFVMINDEPITCGVPSIMKERFWMRSSASSVEFV